MAIRDILVHLDDSVTAESRLDTAILYAQKHEANLRGLYPRAHAFYESRGIDEQSSQNRIEKMFREKTAAAGITSEWVFLESSVVGSSVSDIVTTQAYYSDLVVVGQTNFRSPGPNIPTDLVKACGRPVLVVPYTGTYETAGDRIMIAWKAGRESVRSLNDAMPHIKKAVIVSVVGVSAEAVSLDSDGHFTNIGNYLAKHEVNARTAQICSDNLSIGDTILNIAYERTIDLLVMGAFAPTRMGTLALSPVAQHVLRHLTVPVLLSH
jgi:nucleotide-binding universal stress UspA family protein